MNEALRTFLRILENLGLRYFAVGSVASSIHGIARFTNDVDLVVEINDRAIEQIAARVVESFYMDADEAKRAISQGRAFNVIHLATASKIDVFPFGAGEFHRSELARSVESDWVVPGEGSIRLRVASAEDTILSKLQWYKLGGMVSDRQWSDVLGVATRSDLDWSYMSEGAQWLGVSELLERLVAEVSKK